MWIKSQDEMKMVKCNNFSYRYSIAANQYEVLVNDKIVEEIPTTIFQIQKLFAEHKGKIALSKENLKSNIFIENIHDFYLQKDKEKRRLFIVLKEIKEERKRAKYKEM